MMIFKIGDRVTFVGNNHTSELWKPFKGQKGTVRDMDNTYLTVRFDNSTPNGSRTGVVTKDSVKLDKIYSSHPYTNIFK